jgi:hypothetical protein
MAQYGMVSYNEKQMPEPTRNLTLNYENTFWTITIGNTITSSRIESATIGTV